MADNEKRIPESAAASFAPELVRFRLPEVEGEEYFVEVELGRVGKNAGCVSLKILGYDSSLGLEQSTASGAVNEVSASIVRKIRIGEAIDGALSNLRLERQALGGDIASFPETVNEYLEQIGLPELIEPTTAEAVERRRMVEEHVGIERHAFQARHEALEILDNPSTGRRRGRPPLSDAEVFEAALVYLEAVRSGERSPSKAVAERLHLSPNQARRRVMRARKRGYIEPTKPGQAHA